jgi:Transposase zinc-binding domain/Putative transposase
MLELAEILRQYGPTYRANFGAHRPPSHHQVMHDIADCRTEALGGQVLLCEPGQESRYRDHACHNRPCPKCGHDHVEAWLALQNTRLLPVPYLRVTLALPAELREPARHHQPTFYSLFCRTSAAALQKLAADRHVVGGQLGCFGVLHPWTRDLRDPPQMHDSVAGGGLAADGRAWLAARRDLLVPVKALSTIFRATFRDALKKTPAL